MGAARYDLELEQGADFVLEVRWTDSDGVPIDLDGYTYRAGMSRDYPTAWRGAGTSPPGANPSVEFEVNVVPAPDITTTDVIEVRVSAEATRALDFPGGVWELDASSTDDESVIRLAAGEVAVAFSAIGA